MNDDLRKLATAICNKTGKNNNEAVPVMRWIGERIKKIEGEIK